MSRDTQFTDRANKALADAAALTEQYGHSQVLPIHLAVSLFDPPIDESKDQQQTMNASHSHASAPLFRQVVDRAHGDTQALDRSLKKALVRLPSQEPPPDHISMSPALSKVIKEASDLSKRQKDSFVAIDHLITALSQDPTIQRALAEANVPNTKLIDSAI